MIKIFVVRKIFPKFNIPSIMSILRNKGKSSKTNRCQWNLQKWEKKEEIRVGGVWRGFYHSIRALEKRMLELDLTSFIRFWKLQKLSKKNFVLLRNSQWIIFRFLTCFVFSQRKNGTVTWLIYSMGCKSESNEHKICVMCHTAKAEFFPFSALKKMIKNIT